MVWTFFFEPLRHRFNIITDAFIVLNCVFSYDCLLYTCLVALESVVYMRIIVKRLAMHFGDYIHITCCALSHIQEECNLAGCMNINMLHSYVPAAVHL